MWRFGWAAIAMCLSAFPAAAQTYPSKTVRIIVSYPPGGPTDLVGRTFANKLQEMWGQPVVVENRPGANGNIAAQAVAKSPGDGYTLLLHSSSLVINPILYKAPGYEPFAQFTPVSLLFDYKLVVVVTPSFAVNSLAELVAAAKARPGEITYASAGGVGAPTHLSVEMFKQIAGIDMIHIPYQGGSPAVNDLLGGHVQLMFNNPTQSLPYIKVGKLRGLRRRGAAAWRRRRTCRRSPSSAIPATTSARGLRCGGRPACPPMSSAASAPASARWRSVRTCASC